MDHYYFDICFSKFNEKDKNDNAYLEIHFAGDVPTDKDIQEYINKIKTFNTGKLLINS